MIVLSGLVKKIKYLNPISGFGVVSFEISSSVTKKPITAKGVFGQLYPGYTLHLSGTWEKNDRGAGEIFVVSSFQIDEPTTEEGQYLLLTSGFFEGMTKSIASYLIKHFGNRTLSLLQEDINIISTVPRVGIKTFIKIRDSALTTFMQQARVAEIRSKYEWNLHEAISIVSEFKDATMTILTSRPYAMMARLQNKIPFTRFDYVVQSAGWPSDDDARIREMLSFFVNESLKDGDTLTMVPSLFKDVVQYSGLDEYRIRHIFEALVERRWFSRSVNAKGVEIVQPKKIYGDEKEIATRLAKIVGTPAEKAMRFNANSPELINLKHHQSLAVAGPFFHKVTIISGKPGAGKTTLVRTLLKLIKSQKIKYLALSPTGKAAQRLREVINEDAQTIHRALGCTHQHDSFQFNDVNPLPYDLFLIDEFSMVDTRLFCALLRAIPYTSRIVLIGDVNQLPSVGMGSLLRDLIRSERFYVYWLTQVLRITKDDGSPPTPLQVSDAVLEGRFFIPPNDNEWEFHATENNNETKNRLVEVLSNLLSKGVHPSEIQVFSPTNGDELGVDNLNFVVKKVFKPAGQMCIETGDKVMQRKNNYELAVYNGDIGVVTQIDSDIENASHDDPVMKITLDSDPDTEILYSKDLMPQISLAYSLTGHKSQGSEYPYVIIVIPDNHVALMDRHWFYTVLTRCQKQVFVIGNSLVLERTIKSNRSSTRKTMLVEQLQMVMPPLPPFKGSEIKYRESVIREFNAKTNAG